MLDERSERVNTTGREYRDARHVVTANGAERLDSDLVAHTLHEDNGRGMLDAGNRSAGRRPSEFARRTTKDGLQTLLVTCHVVTVHSASKGVTSSARLLARRFGIFPSLHLFQSGSEG